MLFLRNKLRLDLLLDYSLNVSVSKFLNMSLFLFPVLFIFIKYKFPEVPGRQERDSNEQTQGSTHL